jgi:hypothetical protein
MDSEPREIKPAFHAVSMHTSYFVCIGNTVFFDAIAEALDGQPTLQSFVEAIGGEENYDDENNFHVTYLNDFKMLVVLCEKAARTVHLALQLQQAARGSLPPHIYQFMQQLGKHLEALKAYTAERPKKLSGGDQQQ